MLAITNVSVARHCLHCCKGDQLLLWRMEKVEVLKLQKPWTDCHKICHGLFRRPYDPASQYSNRLPQLGRPGKLVKYYSRVVFSFLFVCLFVTPIISGRELVYELSYMEVVYELSIGTKLCDLERPWTAKWPLFSVTLRNLVVSAANCVKVVDKTITMDNLRILCLVVNVCRGTARRPRYKFINF